MPISYLSGGEQARILIANLMLKSADILILDEPTNDLDIPSLEVLEESLEDFPGALILVTHDRMMLDRTSTHILFLDGKGGAEFFADYQQCEQSFFRLASPPPKQEKQSTRVVKSRSSGLSAAETRELEALPDKIESVEVSIKALQRDMEQPHIASDHSKLQELVQQQENIEKDLNKLFKRWEELEARRTAAKDETSST
jgi:ATP-binding cassette subfamily F protein uup